MASDNGSSFGGLEIINMPPKPRPVDADQLVKDYVGGLGAKALTKKHRTEWRRLKNILAERGVPLRTMSDSVKAGFSRMSKRAAVRAPISMARFAAASRRPVPYGRASRTIPRQARKPCSGCDLCSRISSQSAAVAGPIRRASARMRSIVQPAYRRWLDGMCSATVVCL